MKNVLKKALLLLVAVAVLVVPMNANAALYDENFETANIELSLGTKSYNVNRAHQYAIFSFTPDEEAEYTFIAKNTVIGIASYNGMWVTNEPSPDTITTNMVKWECTGVGQNIWLAAKADKSPLVIIVEKKKIEKVEVEEIIYKNVHTPSPFKFEGDAEALQYVDTFDGVDDTPFRDEDGFYHFGSEDGPLLYVDLDDTMMNLVDAVNYGKLAYVGYDGDVVVTKINYTEAFMEYSANADTDTMLYPLTEDLIQIYMKVGQNNGWYGEDGWIGGVDEDYWMFACYYESPASEDGDGEGDDIIDDGKEPETEDKDDNKTEDNKTEDNKAEDKKDPYATSPSTGNSVAGFAALALVSATAVLVIRKKAEL